MTVQEFYDIIGGNYEEAKIRFRDDSRIKRFVTLFLQEPTLQDLTNAINEKNWEMAFRMAHTIKGTSANMSFTDLHKKALFLTEALRPIVPLNDITLYQDVENAYNLIIEKAKELE